MNNCTHICAEMHVITYSCDYNFDDCEVTEIIKRSPKIMGDNTNADVISSISTIPNTSSQLLNLKIIGDLKNKKPTETVKRFNNFVDYVTSIFSTELGFETEIEFCNISSRLVTDDCIVKFIDQNIIPKE